MSPEQIHATFAGIVSMYGAALSAKQTDVNDLTKELEAARARIKELEAAAAKKA